MPILSAFPAWLDGDGDWHIHLGEAEISKARNDWKKAPNGNVRGSYSSSDEIPEPVSIVLGSNLRKNSEWVSKQQKPVQAKPPLKPDKK
jgi:hypothetical protein